jgi:hypothetical protein
VDYEPSSAGLRIGERTFGEMKGSPGLRREMYTIDGMFGTWNVTVGNGQVSGRHLPTREEDMGHPSGRVKA